MLPTFAGDIIVCVNCNKKDKHEHYTKVIKERATGII